jgi:hypothetical protein
VLPPSIKKKKGIHTIWHFTNLKVVTFNWDAGCVFYFYFYFESERPELAVDSLTILSYDFGPFTSLYLPVAWPLNTAH